MKDTDNSNLRKDKIKNIQVSQSQKFEEGSRYFPNAGFDKYDKIAKSKQKK